MVNEQDNPIGIDRSDDFAKDDIWTINQLHIPVNTPVNILLSTKDVIHNFKLPELRVSQDAISGMQIPVWFEATMTSEEFLEQSVGTGREGKGFQIACAQLCGLGHSKMVGYMTVHDDEGYANWLEEQKEFLLEEDEDDEVVMEKSLYQNRAAGRVRVGSRYVSDPNPTPPTAPLLTCLIQHT